MERYQNICWKNVMILQSVAHLPMSSRRHFIGEVVLYSFVFGLICPLFCPFKASDRWLNPANVSAFWQPNQSVNRPHKWHWTRFTSLDVVKWTFVFSIMPNMIIINIIFRLRLEFRDFAKFWCHTEQKYQRQWPRY